MDTDFESVGVSAVLYGSSEGDSFLARLSHLFKRHVSTVCRDNKLFALVIKQAHYSPRATGSGCVVYAPPGPLFIHCGGIQREFL